MATPLQQTGICVVGFRRSHREAGALRHPPMLGLSPVSLMRRFMEDLDQLRQQNASHA
jgi:hypothetical protein